MGVDDHFVGNLNTRRGSSLGTYRNLRWSRMGSRMLMNPLKLCYEYECHFLGERAYNFILKNLQD